MAFHETKVWQRTLLPNDLDEELRENQSRALILSVRVRDDDAREMASSMLKCVTGVLLSGEDRNSSESALKRMMEIHNGLNVRIGELLREIDGAD